MQVTEVSVLQRIARGSGNCGGGNRRFAISDTRWFILAGQKNETGKTEESRKTKSHRRVTFFPTNLVEGRRCLHPETFREKNTALRLLVKRNRMMLSQVNQRRNCQN